MTKGVKGFPKGHKINLGKKYSEERRQNISKALTGRKISEEWREKLSQSHMGNRQSEDTRRKISEGMKGVSTAWLTGRKLSEETKKKLSEGSKGEKHWNWKGDYPVCPVCDKKLSTRKYGFCRQHSRTEELREKISKANKGKLVGEKNHLWKGGITPLNRKIRTSTEYKEWRTAVFKRDNYTCVLCGDNTSGNLNADHIKRFSDYPELRLEVSNGRTLCIPCHRTTDTYGRGTKCTTPL